MTEEPLLNNKLRILTEALMDEVNEVKGMKDNIQSKPDWWREIDWRSDEYKTIFDSLSDKTRILIIDAGMCPECGDGDKEGECPEGETWSEEHDKCVPKEKEEDVLETNPGFKPGMAEQECPEGEEWNAEKKQCVPIAGFSDRPENKSADKLDPHAVLERYRILNPRP